MIYFLLRKFRNPFQALPSQQRMSLPAVADQSTTADQRSLNALLGTDTRMLKCHRVLVRTGLSTGVAYLIRKGARRRATDLIGVEAVVPGRNNQRAVTVNVHPIRRRTAPRQVRCPFPTY